MRYLQELCVVGDGIVEYDLKKMKKEKVENWPKDCVKKTVEVILESMRPHLGLQLLKHAYFIEK